MAKSRFSTEQQTQINRIMKTEGVVRKTAIRRLFGKKATSAITKSKPKSKRKPKTPSATAAQASKNRAEGLRLFALARRPTKAQFISVHGKRGHLMTWDQRAAAGIPAKNFQAAWPRRVRAVLRRVLEGRNHPGQPVPLRNRRGRLRQRRMPLTRFPRRRLQRTRRGSGEVPVRSDCGHARCPRSVVCIGRSSVWVSRPSSRRGLGRR
jgi:hypothetical protein